MDNTARKLKKMAHDITSKEIQGLFDNGATWRKIASKGYSNTTISKAVKGRSRPRKRNVVTKN